MGQGDRAPTAAEIEREDSIHQALWQWNPYVFSGGEAMGHFHSESEHNEDCIAVINGDPELGERG